MDEPDLTQQQIDVYMTKTGPWNPDHGDLVIPDEWEFLPTGSAFVTRRVKAAGTYWVAWRPRGKNRPHRRRLGLWAPKEVIAEAEEEGRATEEQRAKQRAHGAKAREKKEAAYVGELEEAIRDFLAFAPEHRKLSDEIAKEAAVRAGEVGSGRVGRTRTLTLEKRAELAARALIRHQHTAYEEVLSEAEAKRPWDEDDWYPEIKSEANLAVDDFLERHRRAGDDRPQDGEP